MIKQVLISVIYLMDYWLGRIFYAGCLLLGKFSKYVASVKQAIFFKETNLLEIYHLRDEVRRLKFANTVMRQELNRVKTKRPCLCKKLRIIYFKLRFSVSLRKAREYLPISKASVINYLNQLQGGISNLVSRRRGYYTSPHRTPVRIASLIWEIHRDNPYWGRWKIALAIWKIGVYVSPSTVRNILNSPKPDYRSHHKKEKPVKARAINGQYPNHIWSIDLTTVYVWFKPLYILAVLDHYSRKVTVLTTTFNPTAEWVIKKLKETILLCDKPRYYRGKPKHLISDYGTQFTAGDFKEFVKETGIHHRYAKISKANGNSKVERFFLSLKYEFLNLFLFFSQAKVDRLLKEYLVYYNEHRPHEALDGQTPEEVYLRKPRDKPTKDAKIIKGKIEKMTLGEGLLNYYRLKDAA
ncbi:MAG: integrase core domain-containing protein [Planctomycetota bacterium]